MDRTWIHLVSDMRYERWTRPYLSTFPSTTREIVNIPSLCRGKGWKGKAHLESMDGGREAEEIPGMVKWSDYPHGRESLAIVWEEYLRFRCRQKCDPHSGPFLPPPRLEGMSGQVYLLFRAAPGCNKSSSRLTIPPPATHPVHWDWVVNVSFPCFFFDRESPE